MSFLKISDFIKRTISIILIVSVSFFSPFSHSANPAVIAGAVVFTAKILIDALNTSQGKRLLKKIGKELFGADDYDIDDHGNVKYYKYGECYSEIFLSNGKVKIVGTIHDVAVKSCKVLYDYNNDSGFNSSNISIRELNYMSTLEGRVYRVDCPGYFSSVTCSQEVKKMNVQDVINEIRSRANKGDSDAKEVMKKLFDDDDTSTDKNKKKDDDDDTSTVCKYDSSLQADDKNCKKKKDKCEFDDSLDADDEQCREKKKKKCEENPELKECKFDDDDDDDASNKDAKCNSSEFHKKVCEWIDWTYDETDKAKKKIDDFFDDEEVQSEEKKRLKDLVSEEDVENKKSSFDLVDACPAPKSVTSNFLGRTVTIEVFNFTAICKWADFIAFGLNLTAMIVAINIIAGRKMD